VTVRDFHQALLAAGVEHTYMETEGLGHNKNHIIDRYREVWFDYHVESLRQRRGRRREIGSQRGDRTPVSFDFTNVI
jgi:hypothetical protein